MGESRGWLFEPTFNRSIKLRQADPRISPNAGTLLLREVDHRLGLTADLAAELTDPRDPAHIRYTQSIRKARPLAVHLDVRIDAGLVEGKVLDALDDEGVNFAD